MNWTARTVRKNRTANFTGKPRPLHRAPTRWPPLRLALTLLWACALSASASTLERRLIEVFRHAPDLSGALVELSDGSGPFVALEQPPATATVRGGVILVHDTHSNADAERVIRPLRTRLPTAGWHTLSVQLPTTDPGAGSGRSGQADAIVAQRITAAAAWFGARDIADPVVIAEGDSAAGALAALTASPTATGGALVLLSTSFGADDPELLDALAGLDRPVLDLRAEFDPPGIATSATVRGRHARAAGNTRYRVASVPGASMGFSGPGDGLLATVRAWLHAFADSATGTPSATRPVKAAP